MTFCCSSAEIQPATPASPVMTRSGTSPPSKLDDPAVLGADPRLSAEAYHRQPRRQAKPIHRNGSSSKSGELVTPQRDPQKTTRGTGGLGAAASAPNWRARARAVRSLPEPHGISDRAPGGRVGHPD